MLIRSALFNIAVYLNFLVQALVFSPVLLLPERYFWPIGRFWVRSTLWLHRVICGIDEEFRGRENIPAGGFIVASKHQSAWETLAFINLLERPSFILKRELLWVPATIEMENGQGWVTAANSPCPRGCPPAMLFYSTTAGDSKTVSG